MPLSIKRLNDGGVIIQATGVINVNDIREIKSTLYTDNHSIKNIHYQILDYSQAQDLDLSHEDIWKMALRDKEALQINPHMLIAVISEKDVIYGLSRMWNAYTETTPLNTGVFRDLANAEEWVMQRQISQALSIR
ncbi:MULTISPECIES: hypothetical protein [unclassified Motilimonas]|uniref:hypothetical protein n=1 Tax=Motilimonas TaxID=1914248 RepID=UPI001E6481C6|nr:MULTISPECIES: hypothetical protein [unclassified Motilimonas]MCE0558357.1 hypothetical protein [Motilimonas sp. E26]MDO6525291.1 hypothetical protein [Motilimonas sp. 1_MG-2023]